MKATAAKVFDIPMLAGRLIDAVHWINRQPALSKQPLGLFGASTGAAAALQVAAELGMQSTGRSLAGTVRTWLELLLRRSGPRRC